MSEAKELVQDEQEVKPTEEGGGKDKNQVYNPEGASEIKEYRFADTVISCGLCGKDTIIKHPVWVNVETGIQLPFLRTNNHNIMGLACEHCKSKLTLRFIEALTPPAHDWNMRGMDIPVDGLLEWKAGKDAKYFEVFVAEDRPADENTTDKPELVWSDPYRTDEPKFQLKLEENTSYFLRVDTIYDEIDIAENTVASERIWLSTMHKEEEQSTEVPESIEATIEPELKEID